MREVRDTFLKFLQTNLPSVNIHPIRRDINNPKTEKMQVNAINVGFGRVDFDIIVSTQFVLIDIIADNELDAVTMVENLWSVLNKKQYTPMLDFTNPASPVTQPTTLMWKKVAFIPIQQDAYFQYSATMLIDFHNSLA